MTIDKVFKTYGITNPTAQATTSVQYSTTIFDNTGSDVSKTIIGMQLKASLTPKIGSGTEEDHQYMLIVGVTDPAGSIPNFAGDESTVNTALNTHRQQIWMTESGIVRATQPDDQIVLMEPSTKRTLIPGQKLFFVLLSRNRGTGAAGTGMFMVWDVSLFYNY